jgi:Zn-dependent protease
MDNQICGGCGASFPPSFLACPACGTLVHREELKQLWNSGREKETAGDLSGAAEALRRALDLLPPESVQRGQMQTKLREISIRIDRGEGIRPKKERKEFSFKPKNWGAGLAGIGALLLKFKAGLFLALSKGKLLLLGFKGGLPLLGLLGSFGVYWATWGWAFAAGLMGAIYLHELGHVAALRRFGFKTSAPVFIPGLGAFIRLTQRPTSAVEDARIGLAGPAAGLAATLLFVVAWLIWPKPLLAALISSNAWINLFNLLPVSPLDGGRGMNSLDDVERWAIALVSGGLAYWSSSMLLGSIALIAFIRADDGGALEGDRKGAVTFGLLLIALALLAQWKP